MTTTQTIEIASIRIYVDQNVTGLAWSTETESGGCGPNRDDIDNYAASGEYHTDLIEALVAIRHLSVAEIRGQEPGVAEVRLPAASVAEAVRILTAL